MGLFTRKHAKLIENEPNRYKDHPEVLNQMAAWAAECALKQIRDETGVGDKGETFIIAGSESLDVYNRSPERKYGSWRYELKYSRLGMQKVDYPEMFLDALLPYLKKHVDKLVDVYFPRNTAYVSLVSHYDEETVTLDAISIHVPSADRPEPKPTYKPW